MELQDGCGEMLHSYLGGCFLGYPTDEDSGSPRDDQQTYSNKTPGMDKASPAVVVQVISHVVYCITGYTLCMVNR